MEQNSTSQNEKKNSKMSFVVDFFRILTEFVINILHLICDKALQLCMLYVVIIQNIIAMCVKEDKDKPNTYIVDTLKFLKITAEESEISTVVLIIVNIFLLVVIILCVLNIIRMNKIISEQRELIDEIAERKSSKAKDKKKNRKGSSKKENNKFKEEGDATC